MVIGGFAGLELNPLMLQAKNQQLNLRLDADGSQTISREEFASGLSKKGLGTEKASQLFQLADANGDGEISIDEGRDLAAKIKDRILQKFTESGSVSESEAGQAKEMALPNREKHPNTALELLMQTIDSNRSKTNSDHVFRNGLEAYARLSE